MLSLDPEFVERWWITGFIFMAVYLYGSGYLGYLVQEDAKRRGMNKTSVTFWSVATVFFLPIFLPLYMIFRSQAVFVGIEQDKDGKVPFILCPHCGNENPADEKVCVKCHKRMDISPEQMGTKSCPYCGAMNEVDARTCHSCGQVIGYVDDGYDED